MSAKLQRQASEDPWTAVLERSGAHDGRFVYGVRTTGVYCRPSCPSRRPRRENVEFFADPPAAERGGYRACLRCRPRQSPPLVELVARVCAALDEATARGERLTLDQLGGIAGKSPAHLQRVFKRATGVSPRAYASQRRLAALRRGLRTSASVTDAIYDAGFGSGSRVYEVSDAQLGMTPGTYRRLGEGARMRFTVVETTLGPLLVAGTAHGLCAVRFGASSEQLERELRGEFPRAEIGLADRRLTKWARVVVDGIEGRAALALLPLDVQSSAFQRRVWQALRSIRPGQTRTYGDVARAIGRPTAVRAVARACATNPVAVVVPCHRVVREGGALGGYRWGIRRKRALLAREDRARGIARRG